jgi:ABC-2 type transport system permease protein
MIQPSLVWELARKDLLLFSADRRGMLLCFAVPIALASAFGAVFHRSDDEPARPRVLVVESEPSPLSRRVAEALCGSDKVEASACDLRTAKRRLASESGHVVVILPSTLGSFSANADRPCVELWHPPGCHWEARWVEGVLTEVVLRELLSPVLRGRSLDRPFTVERRTEAASGALAANAFGHSFCGMTLQYLLFWGVDSGLVLLRERRQGIWRGYGRRRSPGRRCWPARCSPRR